MTFNSWHDSVCVSVVSRNKRAFAIAICFLRPLAGRTLAFLGLILFCAACNAIAQNSLAAPRDQSASVLTQTLSAWNEPEIPQAQTSAAQALAPALQARPLTVVGSSEGVPYPLPAQHAGLAASQWQIAEAYQYNHISFRGALAPFGTSGFNSSVTRFLGRYWGVEGDLGAGFGAPAPGSSASSIFVGGGPRLSVRRRTHFEPWGHALVGAQHFNFGGMNFPLNSTSVAWIAGGGLDYRFDSGLAARAQIDYLGSRFGGVFQRNLQLATGIVWNF